jgi:spermidine synthase
LKTFHKGKNQFTPPVILNAKVNKETGFTMKSTVKIAEARTPDGGLMGLYQHDQDFIIRINGEDLMNSRQNESELELARLGCRHLAECKEPRVLIGGLGMGYTLRQTLDMLGPHARVRVGELMGAVVDWNREFLGVLNGNPLEDPRVDLKTGDILELISRSKSRFDAILLDVDNGPDAMTDSGNRRLYGYEGIEACRRALGEKGCLAVWSAKPSKKFEHLFVRSGFHVRRYTVPAYKGSKSQFRFIWVASEDRKTLPPGGGEPRLPKKNTTNTGRRQPPGRPTKRKPK